MNCVGLVSLSRKASPTAFLLYAYDTESLMELLMSKH